MFNLIFSQVYTGNNKLISSAFNEALPKLYAFSMMWTLNAREELRSYKVDGFYGPSGDTSGATRENVELGALGGVHVQRHVERHNVEVRKIFRHSSTGMGAENAPDEYKLDV